jgi:hypothetical protein
MRVVRLLSLLVFTFWLNPLGATETRKITSILYTCNLSFQADGTALKSTSLEGKGTITCYDLLTGATEHRPVKIRAEGAGVGIEVAKVSIFGGATHIGVSTNPESLLGRYAVSPHAGQAARSGGANAAVQLSKGAVTLNARVQTQQGVGFDLSSVELESDGIKTIDKQALNL